MRWLLAFAVALVAAAPAAQPAPSPADGQQAAETIAAILARAAAPDGASRTFTLTERGVNAFLRHQGAELLPAVVVEPVIRLIGDGRLSVRTLIDLDRLREERAGESSDLLQLLSGRVEVRAEGAIRGADGQGVIELESLHVQSIPVPVALLVEAVRAYPGAGGFDLTAPFWLPYGITELRVDPGRAVVVQ